MAAVNQPMFATRRTTAAYLGSFVGLGASALLIGPSIDTFRAWTGASKGRIGILFTVGALGYFAGSLMAGRLLAKRRAHPLLAAGLLTVAVALIAIPFAHQLLWLAGLQVVVGFGGAIIDVTGNSAVLWLHKGGPVLNALHLSFAIGLAVAPVIVARSIVWFDGLLWGYALIAVALIGLAWWVLSLPSPVNPHDEVAAKLTTRQVGLVGLGVLWFVAYVGVEVGFAGWIFEYGVARGLARNGASTWLGTAFLSAFALGRLLSIPIARRVSAFPVLMADIVVCCAALMLVWLGGTAHPALWIGTLVFGIGAASMFPTMLALAEPHIPSTGAVTSAFLAGSAVGSMTIPWMIGRLLDTAGPEAMPKVVLAGTLVTGLIVIVFRAYARSPGHPPATSAMATP